MPVNCRELVLCCFVLAFGAGCGSAGQPFTVEPPSTEKAFPVADVTETQETILLVSLDDGQVIMQTITSEADICFKMAASSATTCLVRGAPIVDPVTSEIIGVEMVETHIDLIARTD